MVDNVRLLARETIPVLTTGSVLNLVVEILPGPRGLVTPDWWPMGLILFPTPQVGDGQCSEEQRRYADFLEATQRVITTVVGKLGLNQRVRWRLEARADQPNSWDHSVVGRSAEAAAAIVARAVCEAVYTGQSPILDPNAAITACLQGMDSDRSSWEFENAALETVEDGSMATKLKMARMVHLSSVFVCEGQGPQAIVHSFPELHLGPCKTLGEAYEKLRYEQRFIKAYRQHIVSEWNSKWEERDGNKPWDKPPYQMDERLLSQIGTESALFGFDESSIASDPGCSHEHENLDPQYVGTRPQSRRRFCISQKLSLLKERIGTRRYISGEQFWRDRHPDQSNGTNERESTWAYELRHNLVARLRSDGDLRRLAVVTAGGLGKSTNLRWIASQLALARSNQVPFFFSLDDTTLAPNADRFFKETLVEQIIKANTDRLDQGRLLDTLDRLRAAGRLTLLLDSIDQAHRDSLHLVRSLLTSAGLEQLFDRP